MLPSADKLCDFLLKRFKLLLTIKPQSSPAQPIKKKSFTILKDTNSIYCKESHAVYACDNYKRLSVKERCKFEKKKKIYRNGLSYSENQKCGSKVRCLECSKDHHASLHFQKELTANTASQQGKCDLHIVLLGTALVKAAGPSIKRGRPLLAQKTRLG